MSRLIIMGFWVLLVTLGALFAGSVMRPAITEAENLSVNIERDDEDKRTQENTDMISVPVMVEGKVLGYILTQLTYVVDAKANAEMDMPLGPFVNDAVFAEFFGAYTDRSQIEKVRFETSRQHIIDAINQRFGAPVIRDLLVQQFNFVAADRISRAQKSDG